MTAPGTDTGTSKGTLSRVTREDLKDIATGAAILGTGGGGDPYVGRLLADVALAQHGPVRITPLGELPDDAVVVAVGVIGAPTIGLEKIQGAEEVTDAVKALDAALPHPVTHIVCTEIGGGNSMVPIVAAARLGLPLVDADGMGRAFPELQMLTPGLLDISATPLGLADEKGNTLVLRSPQNNWAEHIARAVAVSMGCTASYAMYPMAGADARAAYIPGTLSWAHRLGRLHRRSRSDHRDVPAVIAAELDGRVVFSGKVTGVERRTVGGFVRGRALLSGAGDPAERFEIEFQNENLVARYDGRIVATVPDLICVVESDGGAPITTENLGYGTRASVLVAPSDPRWRTERGLALVGPRYFGYDLDYVPFEHR
ncbi:DUF917 domain-containing protein [Streptomyces shenzhenensis]|uniref:DUF917 domain-containing protein n=1 Tax=Streptomyces shenzhenensis TaxID=943815 RepID=UPI0033CD6CEC